MFCEQLNNVIAIVQHFLASFYDFYRLVESKSNKMEKYDVKSAEKRTKMSFTSDMNFLLETA